MARSALATAASLVALRAFALLAGDRWPLAGGGRAGRGPTSVDEVIEAVLTWSGIALSGWLAAGALLTTLSLAPGAAGRVGAALAARVTPALVRRVLVLGVGVGLGTLTLPSGATAAPGQPATTATASSVAGARACTLPAAPPPPRPVTGGAPSPGWRPTRPSPSHAAGTAAVLAPPPRHRAAALDTVTVRRGDSLWGIAAHHLGPDASAGSIAREWPRWYAANRAVIGDDPNLIRPGTLLLPPPDGSPT